MEPTISTEQINFMANVGIFVACFLLSILVLFVKYTKNMPYLRYPGIAITAIILYGITKGVIQLYLMK